MPKTGRIVGTDEVNRQDNVTVNVNDCDVTENIYGHIYIVGQKFTSLNVYWLYDHSVLFKMTQLFDNASKEQVVKTLSCNYSNRQRVLAVWIVRTFAALTLICDIEHSDQLLQ